MCRGDDQNPKERGKQIGKERTVAEDVENDAVQRHVDQEYRG
jgi:hypothetical protein